MVKSFAVLVTAYLLVVGLAGWGAFGRLSAAPAPEQWQAVAGRDEVTSTLRANHIVYDPVRDRLYASVPGTDANRPNSVVAMSRDGRVSDPLSIGSNPDVLALSAGAAYLYVGLNGTGQVRRVNLATMQPDPPWTLGNDITCGLFVAADLVVLSDNPNAVAVARQNPCRAAHAGVAVIDNGVMRPTVTPGAANNDVIEPSADPAQLFGFDANSVARSLRRLAVGLGGVTETQSIPNLFNVTATDIRYHDGRLYATNGEAVDALTLEHLGRFDIDGVASLPVVRNGRAFFLQYNPGIDGYELLIFDATSFQFLASAIINGLVDQDPGKPIDFIDAERGSMGVRVGDGGVYWLQVQLIEYAALLPVIAKP